MEFRREQVTNTKMRSCCSSLILVLGAVASLALVVAQREVPLTIERPSLVTPGDPAALRCLLSSNNSMVAEDTCTFTTPGGKKLVVNFITGAVTDGGTNSAAPGYTGIMDETNRQICGLDIAAVDAVSYTHLTLPTIYAV